MSRSAILSTILMNKRDTWVVPTDIPLVEANQLKLLYDATDGANWSDNTNWGATATASNWFGITVAGGVVTVLNLGTNNLVGSLEHFQPSTFTAVTLLYFNNNTVSGDISNWRLPSTLTFFRLHNTSLSGDMAGLVIPAPLRVLRVFASSISGAFDMTSAAAIEDYQSQNCALIEGDVDDILEGLYDNWAALTFATPVLNISGTNAAPSGIYQDATPPTTGKEWEFKLETDPDTTGNNTWTITTS